MSVFVVDVFIVIVTFNIGFCWMARISKCALTSLKKIKLQLVPMMINITKDELVARVSNHNRGKFWSREKSF